MKTIYLVLAAAAAVHLALATSTSSPSATARQLQASGTLRLAQGTAPGVGRLEVFERGQWGTVCDDSFGTNEGTVACRLLGYNNYVADSNGGSLISVRTSSTAVPPVTNECAVPILWDDVQCNAPIFPGVPNCNFRSGAWGSENCSPSENVVLGCTNSLTGRLTGTPSTTRLSNCIPGSTRFRLAGGSSTYGRLEVSYDGTCSQSLAQVMNAGCTTPVGSIWGSVCDDGFSNFDANAVCQTLGFAGASFNSNQFSTSGTASTSTRSFYPVTAQASSSTNIWLDNVDCPTSALTATQGSFSSLCRHNGIGVDNCVHSEDVTLACSNNATYPGADVPSGTTSPSTNGGSSGGPSTGGTTGGSSGDTGNSDLGTTLGTVIPIIFVFCIASFIFRTVMARRRAQAAAQSAASSNPAHSSALSGGSVARQKMVLAMTGGGTTTSASMQPAAQPQVHPPAVPNAYMTPGAPPGSGVGASTYASPTPYPGATPYPGSAAGYPAPVAAPAAPAYPGAAPAAYPGAAPGMGGYPGAPPAMGAYPGAPPGPAAYPGAPPPAVGGYPGAPAQNQAYPSAPPNFNAPPAY